MTKLEFFAYFVVPCLTVAMAAVGYLIIRITSKNSDRDPFYYPIFKYDRSKEHACISPRLERQIFSVFPAQVAIGVEADMEHVLRDTIETSPDDFHRTLDIFQRDLKAARSESILSRLNRLVRPPAGRTGRVQPIER